MSQGIENKVVVTTGASSGLGEATARRLAQDGAKLIWAPDALIASTLLPRTWRWTATPLSRQT